MLTISTNVNGTNQSATQTPLAILAVALITSKGAHGVPGSAIVILVLALASRPAA
jgi:aerobic C4-dicarboxylate transport protein